MRPPSVIIVARHGARLDAADDEWQLRSQAPYDSPLSYGGWTQTRALGARIAALLHARHTSTADDHTRSSRRRQSDAGTLGRSLSRDPLLQSRKGSRKTKVVVHTSPFLRCVQSSIAISAGMAQYHGNLSRLESRPRSPKTPKPFGAHSRAQTLDSKAFEGRYNGRKGDEGAKAPTEDEEDFSSDFSQPTLRVDACLGEWLSPDYYDFTTSPPPSNMMVALAKAELLKSAEPLQGAKIFEPDGSVTEFPGGGANGKPVHHERPRSSTISMVELARVVPSQQSMNGSRLGDDQTAQKNPDTDASSAQPKPRYCGYIPPTPTYALLPSASIPMGYVAHARDTCIEIDFAWDSMREPQSWGDGGRFGEEWGAMHRRFRGGLASMVHWYRDKGPDFDPQDDEKLMDQSTDDDDDTDVALVIMTHGAGCNALIGALTNQPVLMDVGMGSLTMAVHKPRTLLAQSPNDVRRNSSTSFRRRRRSSVVDIGLSEDYDVKLMASTEHLRAGPDPLVIPQLAQSGHMTPIPEQSRRGPGAAPLDRSSSTKNPELLQSKNSSLGSMRRTSVKSFTSRNFSPSPSVTTPTSSGLWGSRGATVDKVMEDEAADVHHEASDTAGGATEGRETQARHFSIGETPSSATSQRSPGLWGSTPTEDAKRRYTVGSRR